MKQAYTNTIRGSGGRNPLTIATGPKKGGGGGGGRNTGGKKSSRQKQQQVPKCAYGAACTRKGCAYRHPTRTMIADSPEKGSRAVYESYHEDPSSQICKPFLANLCTYGSKCLNRHPGPEEAESVRLKYKQKPCSYGDECQTEGCLYFHPWEAGEEQFYPLDEHQDPHMGQDAYGDQISTAVNGLTLESGAVHYSTDHSSLYTPTPATAAAAPTYEQWLAMGCHPPSTLANTPEGQTQLYNMWHYPGSGLQRDPWEVYSLMYPDMVVQQNEGAEFNGTSNGDGQDWTATPEEDDPKTFDEWKKKGCPYPAWFYEADHGDPWYDDSGLRRGFEEVYEVLYKEGARDQHNNRKDEETTHDPTPAESATTPTDPSSPAIQLPKQPSGWAGIAAKRPDPSVLARSPSGLNPNSRTFVVTGAASANVGTKTVSMPEEAWLPDTANSDFFHIYPDPIERFMAVNERHKSVLANRTIPRTFPNSGGGDGGISRSKRGGSGVALIDMHFQSAKTAEAVLDKFLTLALINHAECWIVTGSGHHVGSGHQKREERGVLFNVVRRYLDTNADTLEHRIGKDGSGNRGAFVVREL